ncbi:MAG: carbohydrate kinase family protein, partial [Bacteroidota bacterium]|nr:carbohydrate kinase family protein [Bacteroidota bacterium]
MSKEQIKSTETRRNIYAVGECLLDIIFKNSQPAAAVPGGSMLNSAVSLGKVGLSVHLISDLTHDRVADVIISFLEKNGVSIKFINRYNEGKTAISLAFLDKSGDADYSFYKIYPKKRLTGEFPVVTDKDIVLFGSFYSLTSELRRPLV